MYEPIATVSKREIWKEITWDLSVNRDEKVIIGGDFNAMLNNSEKQRGIISLNRYNKIFKNLWTLIN